MFCGACGAKNDDRNRFCEQCGADLMQFVVPGKQAATPAPAQPRGKQRPSSIPNPGPAVRPGGVSAPAPASAPRPSSGNVQIPRGPMSAPVPAPASAPAPAFAPTVAPAPVTYVPAGNLHAAPAASASTSGQIGNPRKGTTVLDDLMSTSAGTSSSALPRIAADAPRSASAPKVTLVRERGTRYSITEFPASVGKGSAANVRIEGNTAISRVHALITFTGDGFVIEDKGSTNGTFLNGDILAQGELVKLHAGDILRLGDEDFKVEIR